VKTDEFLNLFIKRGDKKISSCPAPGANWDWYGIVRQMTEEVDFGCKFEKFAPGCKNHKRSTGICCCGACFATMGYVGVLPNNYDILREIAKVFVEPEAIGTITASGFWKKGVGCRLPRKYRSFTCLRHYCGENTKMSKKHIYLITRMLRGENYIRHHNEFLKLYPNYAGKLPTSKRLSNKFKKAFWHYVGMALERSNIDIRTSFQPQHIEARKTSLSEVERCLKNGDWNKLKKIIELFGPWGPVDDSFRLQGIADALLNRCERENWKGDISAERALALAGLLLVNRKTGTVHVGAGNRNHDTLCNSWTSLSDMQITTSMNITCKRCLNILKIRRNI
jgi:hypothetical protein